ncbi:MAG: ATP-binding cassette domain-containing protein [Flavobacteriales bacterium]|jgi:cell division transport system ATP-binding protein|tara:strand:+ start:13820 stop:14485 length:666 start_codon:yes stop_codon:yes gene_type:complete
MSKIEVNHADIFQKEHLILSDVTFNIQASEFVYLIGDTGSGKSSLLKTLYGELPLKNGTINVSDYQLFNLKKEKIPFLRRKIGIVFQDFQLLPDRSVHENLAFVLKATGWKIEEDINNRINEVLEKVNMQDHIYKMPHELSGGEQQRVCISRALLNDPKVILADEPTGNLDPDTTNRILELLHELCKGGCAILMATHEHTLLERFPAKIIKCEEGKLIALN